MKILWDRIDALEQLLACYRVGGSPTEKLHKKLNSTRKAIEEIKNDNRKLS